MLTAVYQVGEYIKEQKKEDISSIIQNPNQKNIYNHVLKIVFEVNSNNVSYYGVNYEEFSIKKLDKYAYKKGSPRGGDITPTSIFTKVDRTINKLISSIKTILKESNKKLEDYKLFDNTIKEINKNKEKIFEDVEKSINEINFKKNEGTILTISYKKVNEFRYVGDINLIREHLKKNDIEQYYKKYEKISKGIGVCYYCGQTKDIFGFVNTYNSYTLDKINFVSGGFNQGKAFKNYPVCGDCAKILEHGKKYLNEKFTSKFSGFDYTIIPKLINKDIYSIEDVIETIEEFEGNKNFSTNKHEKSGLLSSESYLLECMSEVKNFLNYNILIFKEEQSGNVFRILLYIEDVLPSKIKYILKIKDEIDEIKLFKNLAGKDKEKYDLFFNFGIIREFFPSNKLEGDFNKYFLEILNNIFTFKKISYDFYLKHLNKKIRNKFLNGENYELCVLKSLMSVLFIEKLDLFKKRNKDVNFVVVEINEKNKKYLNFINEYIDFFDDNYKKAVFLEGVLVSNLLSIQYNEKKSKPFYSRLNGLKLNEKLINRIYVETINKLNEYDKNYYSTLEELISNFMLSKNTLTNDEMSYYFVLGMTMGKRFKDKNEDEVNLND